jgi:hypothetical protein
MNRLHQRFQQFLRERTYLKNVSPQTCRWYPYLEAEDIAAVLEFAARQNDHPVLRRA